MPEPTLLIAWSDTSLTDSFLGIGYEICIYDPDGNHEFVETGNRGIPRRKLRHEYDVEKAEYRAAISTVRRAASYVDGEHHWHRPISGNRMVTGLVLVSDNQGIVDKIQYGTPVSQDGYFQHCIYSFLEWFDEWRVQWTSRENNSIADSQAQIAFELQEKYGDTV